MSWCILALCLCIDFWVMAETSQQRLVVFVQALITSAIMQYKDAEWVMSSWLLCKVRLRALVNNLHHYGLGLHCLILISQNTHHISVHSVHHYSTFATLRRHHYSTVEGYGPRAGDGLGWAVCTSPNFQYPGLAHDKELDQIRSKVL